MLSPPSQELRLKIYKSRLLLYMFSLFYFIAIALGFVSPNTQHIAGIQ